MSLTRNAANQSNTRTATGGGSSVGELVTYSPRSDAVILDADGRRCVLMVNSADTLLSIGTPVANGNGQAATALSLPGRVDSPMVFFRRW